MTPSEKKAYMKAYHKKWYQAHREEMVARAREWYRANKERAKRARAAYRAANPDQRRQANRKYILRKKYGLTPEQHAQLVASQQGRCANPFCFGLAEDTDHEHSTGVVRGLLCGSCNKALGMVNDSIERLTGLIRYLKQPPARRVLTC